jgi:hypothetical protein
MRLERGEVDRTLYEITPLIDATGFQNNLGIACLNGKQINEVNKRSFKFKQQFGLRSVLAVVGQIRYFLMISRLRVQGLKITVLSDLLYTYVHLVFSFFGKFAA